MLRHLYNISNVSLLTFVCTHKLIHTFSVWKCLLQQYSIAQYCTFNVCNKILRQYSDQHIRIKVIPNFVSFQMKESTPYMLCNYIMHDNNY